MATEEDGKTSSHKTHEEVSVGKQDADLTVEKAAITGKPPQEGHTCLLLNNFWEGAQHTVADLGRVLRIWAHNFSLYTPIKYLIFVCKILLYIHTY